MHEEILSGNILIPSFPVAFAKYYTGAKKGLSTVLILFFVKGSNPLLALPGTIFPLLSTQLT